MRLVSTAERTLTTVTYKTAGRGGGSVMARLPVQQFQVDRLPSSCEALLVAGDLQGIAPDPLSGAATLLGVAVAGYLELWAGAGLMPGPERIGILLTGDLYSDPSAARRGASGPVDDVWLGFAAAGCPMIIGLTGNHDQLQTDGLLDLGPSVSHLDGSGYTFGNITFAGVSGVMGNADRPGRRTPTAFLAALTAALALEPDVLLLHEGPPGTGSTQFGNERVGIALRVAPPSITFCGHIHWPHPASRVGENHVINVDSRVVLLTT